MLRSVVTPHDVLCTRLFIIVTRVPGGISLGRSKAYLSLQLGGWHSDLAGPVVLRLMEACTEISTWYVRKHREPWE